jgi:hypothetical protein
MKPGAAAMRRRRLARLRRGADLRRLGALDPIWIVVLGRHGFRQFSLFDDRFLLNDGWRCHGGI